MPAPDPTPKPTDATKARVSNIEQMAAGQRSHRMVWAPASSLTGAAWVALAAQTASISMRRDALPAGVPTNAIGVMVIVTISSNSTTANVVTFSAYADTTSSGGINSGSAGSYTVTNTTAAQTWRTTLTLPLVDGLLRWEAAASSAASYGLQLHLAGYVLA